MKPELVDVRNLVKETIGLLFPPSHINFEVQADLPTFYTNKLHLFQVFQNLLSNAIKYNDKQDAKIEVGMEDAGEFYKFFVKDNGQGIADRDQEKVFKLFTVTDNVSSADSSTGVGLNMLKVLVEEQGGKLWVESKKGKGSCFFFEWHK